MTQQLPDWKQVHLVASLLTGEAGRLNLDEMSEPWKTIAGRLAKMDTPGLEMAERALWRATDGIEDRNELIERVLAGLPGGTRFPSLHEIAEQLQPVEWLWARWIPRGMLSLLGAAPGAGKSLVALDLARRIIHGAGFPDGSEVPEPGRAVVYVDAEAVPQLLNERALAWEMDRRRLYLMMPETYGMLDFGREEHQDQLIRMCHRLQPELVVIDSLSSISVRGENNVEDVRQLLGFLSTLAREFGCGLLLIHHLRKRILPMLDVVGPDDFRGSSHIIAMARSVLGLGIVQTGPEQDRNGPRRLEVVKTNLCRYPKALGIMFEPIGEDGVLLRYDEPPAPFREATETEQCAEWLLATLRDLGEPVKPKELVGLARDAGFKRDTVYKARKTLEGQIVNTEAKRSPANCWALADDQGAQDDQVF